VKDMSESQDLEELFKNMLIEQEEVTKQDQAYQEDIENSPIKVQWNIKGLLAYQIFEKDNYSFKFGEELNEPDITLVIEDYEAARLFLTGEMGDYSTIPKDHYVGTFELIYTEGWNKIETEKGYKNKRTTKPFLTAYFDKDKEVHPFILTKLPMFRTLREKVGGKNNYGVYVPINKSLGNFENKVLPIKIFKHFIDKACSIVMEDICGCRLIHECEHHDISLGCMHMGADTSRIDLEDLERGIPQKVPGRYATKEEALERVQLAYDSGLIPLLGRSRAEAIASGVTDTGRILSMCFCCSCCCVNAALIQKGSPSLSDLYRIEGLTVKVDEEICVGCGDCLEVCVFKGMEMKDDKAIVNEKFCLGCGRCEDTCPNGAISIDIDDSAYVDELISKIESYADVS
jgi:UDP-glucose 4-epimerase